MFHVLSFSQRDPSRHVSRAWHRGAFKGQGQIRTRRQSHGGQLYQHTRSPSGRSVISLHFGKRFVIYLINVALSD